jgi:hypothetical protein
MKTLQVGNKMVKDLEARLHGDIIAELSPSKDGFKLQALATGYAHKGWVAGRPVFEPFEAILKYEITSARSPKGYVIYSWSYQGTAGVQVHDHLRNLTHRSTELERLFGTSDVLGDYVFKEIETDIKVYLNTYF